MELKPVEKSKQQIPNWNGNLKLPIDQQVVLCWKSFPKPVDMGKYKSFFYGADGELHIQYNNRAIFEDHLDHIENLKIGTPIKTAKDLLEHDDARLELLIVLGRNYALSVGEEMDEGESEASE